MNKKFEEDKKKLIQAGAKPVADPLGNAVKAP